MHESLLPTVEEDEKATSARRTPRWWWVLLYQLPQSVGTALLLPILPNLKLNFFHGNAAETAQVQSLAESLRAALMIAVCVQLGRLSDVIGRKPLLFVSVMCTLAPLLVLNLSSNLDVYFLIFALVGGLGGENNCGNKCYVADCCKAADRAVNYGRLNAATSVAMILASPVTGWLQQQGCTSQQLLLLPVAFVVLSAVIALIVPESLPERSRQEASPSQSKACLLLHPGTTLRQLRHQLAESGPIMQKLVMLKALRGLMDTGMMTVRFFALVKLVDFNTQDFGVWISLRSLFTTVGQIIFLPILRSFHCGRLLMLFISSAMMAVQMSAYSFLGTFGLKSPVFALCVLEIGWAIWDPAITALMTEVVNEDRGVVLGMLQAVDGVSGILGHILFSVAFTFDPSQPFSLSTLLNVVSMALTLQVYMERRAQATQRSTWHAIEEETERVHSPATVPRTSLTRSDSRPAIIFVVQDDQGPSPLVLSKVNSQSAPSLLRSHSGAELFSESRSSMVNSNQGFRLDHTSGRTSREKEAGARA